MTEQYILISHQDVATIRKRYDLDAFQENELWNSFRCFLFHIYGDMRLKIGCNKKA